VHGFMSLDGVIDAPTWTFDYGFDLKMGEGIGAVTERSRGQPARADDLRDVRASMVYADRRGRSGGAVLQRHHEIRRVQNAHHPDLEESELIGPYDPDAIRKLKGEVDGDLYVSGSGTLVRAMLADGLVDELHLFVYPRTRGSGPRLFSEDVAPAKFSLAASDSYDNGVVYLAYRPGV
jgi:riboflavin biosynthesis pyrimidine reductase